MIPAASVLDAAELVAIATPDQCGRLIGKRRPVADWERLRTDGLAGPDFHLVTGLENKPYADLAITGEKTGFHNGLLIPDDAAAFVSPSEPRTVIVIADAVHADRRPAEESPRRILRRQVTRLAERGLTGRAASELEFYAFKEDFETLHRRGFRDLRPLYHRHGDNDILVSGYADAFNTAIAANLRTAGIAFDQSQGEAGPGQIEINMEPAGILAAADNHVAFKHIVKATAEATGRSVTFLAKPFRDEASSGGHIHISLADRTGANALATTDGLTPFGAAFVAGIVAFTPELTLLHAPYANSYRRLVPGSFSPLTANWAYEARTAMIRLVGRGPQLRIEFRLPGADANPYLSCAALIGAGLAGVDRGLVLEAGAGGALPGDLTESVLGFAASKLAGELLLPEVASHLLALARHELAATRREVTPWEVERGFETA